METFKRRRFREDWEGAWGEERFLEKLWAAMFVNTILVRMPLLRLRSFRSCASWVSSSDSRPS